MSNFIGFLLATSLFISQADGMTVGVMATDKEELGNIVSFLQEPYHSYNHGMRTFYKGKLWGHETVIVLSNIGKVAAASATVDLINEGVDLIVFIGTAGALDKRLNIGDVVLAEHVVEYDVDFRPCVELYQLPDQLSSPIADAVLNKMAEIAITNFFKSDGCSQNPKVITTTIGTADHFLVSEEEIQNLRRYAPDVVCVDMESSAIAQTASNYGVPFTIIRTVSNYIDTPSADHNYHVALDYMDFLQNVQVIYTENILRCFFAELDPLEAQPFQEKVQADRLAIGILCTTPNELRSLLKLLDDVPLLKGSYYYGTIKGCAVIFAQSGYGKSSVGAAAEALISQEHIKALIVVGGAKSADSEVKAGDIVISSSLIEYDVDVRPFRPLYELPTIGIMALPAQIALIPALKPGVHCGQMASGDKILDAEALLTLKENLPRLLCVDFDSAAAAQVAYQSSIPFLSIKQISDRVLQDVELENELFTVLINILENNVILD